MSGRSGVWVVVAVVALMLKLALFASRSSRPTSYGSNYGSNSYSNNYGLPKYDPYKAKPFVDPYAAQAKSAKRELEDALEATVDRNCKASAHVYLEPQGTQAAAFHAMRTASSPKLVLIPQPWNVLGLPVIPVSHDDADGVAVCLDADDALIRELSDRSEGPRAEALEQVGPGAWLVITSPEEKVPAAAALVSKRFLDRMKTKGALVAFAPTDGQLAFADSASPAAVKLAASALAPKIDLTGDSGIDFSNPLILERGAWKEWKPPFQSPELKSVMARSAEANVRGIIEVLAEVALLQNPLLGDTVPHLVAVDDAISTERTWSSTEGATVYVTSGSLDPQFVGRAARVNLGSTTLTWEHFTKAAGTKLRPANIDGKPVPGVYVLDEGFALPAMASANP